MEDADNQVLAGPVALPAKVVSAPRGDWRLQTVGAIVQSTVETLGLPATGGVLLYNGVSDQTADKLHAATVSEGYSRDFIITYEPPPPLIPAATLPAVGFGLTILLLALAVAATWSGARTLQRFVALLVYLGVSPAKARTTAVLQNAWLFLIATGFGLLLAAVPTVITLTMLTGFVISIPWISMITLAITLFVACAFSSFTAAPPAGRGRGPRRLTRTDFPRMPTDDRRFPGHRVHPTPARLAARREHHQDLPRRGRNRLGLP